MSRRLSALVLLSVAVHGGLAAGALALVGGVVTPPLLFVDLVADLVAAGVPVASGRGPGGGAPMVDPGGARARSPLGPAVPAPGPRRAPSLESRREPAPRAHGEPVTPPTGPLPANPEPGQPALAPAPPAPESAPAVVEPVRPGPQPPVPNASAPQPLTPSTQWVEPAPPSAFTGGPGSGSTAAASARLGQPGDGATGASGATAGGPVNAGRGAGEDGGGAGLAGGSGAGSAVALAVPGDGADDAAQYGAYLALVRRRIHELLTYPSSARNRGFSGSVLIEVEITATGAVGQVLLAASSSHRVLDEAALDAARGLRRVPFPPDVPPRPLRVRLPVVFDLR